MNAFFNQMYTLWNQLINALANIRFFDIIDIIFIAFIIYKAIEFLRETRAGQLVKGILVLIVMYIFADVFELAVLHWLMRAIMGSAIVALAIVFQPELRRILERVGQVKFGYNQHGSESSALTAVDNICKAVATMQKNKIGALIVFERKTQLGEIINTGTLIDANTSSAMIENIFFPKSPLHDGAVIIRDGRVHAAGCILPLTQSTAFSSSLGTRHRAAIGMTENSDAVVLIVSEETGTISIAVDGGITRDYNSASAYDELKNLLIDFKDDESDNSVVTALKKILPFQKKQNEDVVEKEEANDEV